MASIHTLIFASLVFAAVSLHADPFVVIDDSPQPTDADRQVTISRLKFRAVAEWLERYLGPAKFAQIQKSLTQEFAERHIVTFVVGRAPGNRTQIEGELDAAALRGWVNLSAGRAGDGTTLRPAVVFGSKLGGTPLAAEDSGAKNRDNANVQTVTSLLNSAFSKLGITLSPPRGGIGLADRPRNESDVKYLAGQASLTGTNAVVWVQLGGCRECGGVRADFSLVNFQQGRVSLSTSYDIAYDPASPLSPEKLRSLLKSGVEDFRVQVETLLASGAFFASVYTLRVDGLPSTAETKAYRLLKAVDAGLAKTEFISGCKLKQLEPGRAQFEILSNLPAQELLQRLGSTAFASFRLRPVSSDAALLVAQLDFGSATNSGTKR